MNLEELQQIAEEAAREAGRGLVARFRGPAVGVDHKTTPTDLVSDADRVAENVIKEHIRARRPQDAFLGEESGLTGAGDAEVTWVADPLDGTVNYLFGLPAWCVSVAAKWRGTTVAGVIHQPLLDETFSATKDGGAFLNRGRIRVGDRDELSTALIGTGFAYDSRARKHQARVVAHVLPRVRDVRRAGSAAMDLASLACGRLDGFYEAPLEEWDKTAGLLLIEEAGGIWSELAGPHGLSNGVIAANPVLHPKLEALIEEA